MLWRSMQEERRSDLRERERDLTHLSLVIASEIRPQKNAKRNIHFWCDP
jgi:hypothetical protein